jgi:hypothetical protein
MIPYTKEERWEILRLAKRARGLTVAEQQALVFVADALTMQGGVCCKALSTGKGYGYSLRNLQWGLHGKKRDGKTEYIGVVARGIVIASGNIKGGRAAGGRGLPATYTIDRDVLLTYVPEIDDPDPKGDGKKGGPYPDPQPKRDETMGETYHETKGETLPKKGETKDDLMHTSSCSSSLPPSSANVTGSTEAAAAASAPTGEPSLTTTIMAHPTRETELGKDINQNLGGGDGCANFSKLAVDTRVLPRDGAPTSGHLAAPTSGVPLPSASNHTHEDSQLRGQNETDQSEALIASARARQLERSMTNYQIFQDYKNVFDRLRREHDAHVQAVGAAADAARALTGKARLTPEQQAVLDAMPQGRKFENPLASNQKHVAVAADFYRAVGGAATIAKWEDFLLNADHRKFVGVPLLDDEDHPTGQHYSDEEEAKWLLYDFVKAQGGVPQPKLRR